MKPYATINSERGTRPARQGNNECLHIELTAFNRMLGEIIPEIMGDPENKPQQYLLTYLPNEDDSERHIIEEGHRHDRVLQRMRPYLHTTRVNAQKAPKTLLRASVFFCVVQVLRVLKIRNRWARGID
jgi:hypothetical protein